MVLATDQEVCYFDLLKIIEFKIKEKDSLGGIAPEEIHYKDFMQNLPVSEFKVGEEMLIRGIDDLGMG